MSEPLTDLPDETAEPEPTPEPEPEPDDEEAEEAEQAAPAEPEQAEPEAVTPEEYEKRAKATERALAAYSKKITEIWAEDGLHLIPCPLCTFGATQGFVDERDAGRIPDEVVKLALSFLGRAAATDYEDDQEHRECPRCKGLGKVKTGSRVPQWETLTCSACQGTGMSPPPQGLSGQPATAPLAVVQDNGQQPDAQYADADEWGEPRLLPDGRDNPNFGKMPHRKIEVAPWGVTAGLSAQDAVPTPA